MERKINIELQVRKTSEKIAENTITNWSLKKPEKDKSNLATWMRFLNTDDNEELDKIAVKNVAESPVSKSILRLVNFFRVSIFLALFRASMFLPRDSK